VSDTRKEDEARAFGAASKAETKNAIRVKLDLDDERIVELTQGTKVSEVLEIVAGERGCDIRELVLVREGDEVPLVLGVVVVAGYPHKHCHHVHYLGEVKVTVYYQASQDTREFKRFEAVKDVLAWAIDAFRIDASLATELELARHGQTEELPEREHIGHLVGKGCDLELDLVRGDIANGSAPW